jgi:hypothetical protein
LPCLSNRSTKPTASAMRCEEILVQMTGSGSGQGTGKDIEGAAVNDRP